MSHHLVRFSIGLVVLMSSANQREDFPGELRRWYVTDPPEVRSDQWFAANADVDHEWVVTPGDTDPRVKIRGHEEESSSSLPFVIKSGSPREGLAGNRTTAKVDDGWIVGFNAGEFGAGLWWFSPKGERRYRISDDHVIGLIPTSSGLLGVEGVAHGGISRGRVFHLSRKANGQWMTEPYFDLVHAPEVVMKDTDGSLVVATTERLLRIFPASKKSVVMVDKAFWGGLYPNSMVITPAGTIFLGMRHGVAKVEQKGASYKVSWLLPNKRVADDKGDDRFKGFRVN
jgi:hypothetical protein